jgi:NADH:ubiquinone oxidoreductase subunit 6 (subunit J)
VFNTVNYTTILYSGTFNGLEWNSMFTSYYLLKSLGLVLYSTYSIWLIVGGFILLLAIIAPIVLTLRPAEPLH